MRKTLKCQLTKNREKGTCIGYRLSYKGDINSVII